MVASRPVTQPQSERSAPLKLAVFPTVTLSRAEPVLRLTLPSVLLSARFPPVLEEELTQLATLASLAWLRKFALPRVTSALLSEPSPLPRRVTDVSPPAPAPDSVATLELTAFWTPTVELDPPEEMLTSPSVLLLAEL